MDICKSSKLKKYICGSGSQCILRTKIIDWDYRTRMIEHKLQMLYNPNKPCAITVSNLNKYVKQRNHVVRRLSRQLYQTINCDHTSKTNYLSDSMKSDTLYSLVNAFAPTTYMMYHSMEPKKVCYRLSELMLSHLADLPPVCLGCLPKGCIISLIDSLLETRLIHKLPQPSTKHLSLGLKDYHQSSSQSNLFTDFKNQTKMKIKIKRQETLKEFRLNEIVLRRLPMQSNNKSYNKASNISELILNEKNLSVSQLAEKLSALAFQSHRIATKSIRKRPPVNLGAPSEDEGNINGSFVHENTQMEIPSTSLNFQSSDPLHASELNIKSPNRGKHIKDKEIIPQKANKVVIPLRMKVKNSNSLLIHGIKYHKERECVLRTVLSIPKNRWTLRDYLNKISSPSIIHPYLLSTRPKDISSKKSINKIEKFIEKPKPSQDLGFVTLSKCDDQYTNKYSATSVEAMVRTKMRSSVQSLDADLRSASVVHQNYNHCDWNSQTSLNRHNINNYHTIHDENILYHLKVKKEFVKWNHNKRFHKLLIHKKKSPDAATIFEQRLPSPHKTFLKSPTIYSTSGSSNQSSPCLNIQNDKCTPDSIMNIPPYPTPEQQTLSNSLSLRSFNRRRSLFHEQITSYDTCKNMVQLICQQTPRYYTLLEMDPLYISTIRTEPLIK